MKTHSGRARSQQALCNEVESDQYKRRMLDLGPIIIRVLLYSLWAAAAVQLALAEIRFITWQDPFSELGFVEITQSVFLALSAILFFQVARSRPQQARLALCGALVMLALFIRENDQPLELFLPHGAWKWIAAPVIVLLGWQCFRHWNAIIEQLRSLAAAPPFGVFLSAWTVLLFSRIFGSRKVWEPIASEASFRPVKNAVQEGIELFALGLLFAATVEFFLWARRMPERESGDSE